MLDHGKDRKLDSKRKWKERDYHVQDRKYVQQKSVKMSCASTQFSALPFCGPHEKSHRVRGLSKHHHLRIDPRLGNSTCAIRQIPFACNECSNMLDKPWAIYSDLIDQPRYQPVKD